MNVLNGTDLRIIGVFIMAGLGNKEYYLFLAFLIVIIAGIYAKLTFLFFIGCWFMAALMGWVARGDKNERKT